jgi:two-component sensor histidine kinase
MMHWGLLRGLSLNDRLLLIVLMALLPVSILIVGQGIYAREYLNTLASERLIANTNATALAESQVFDRVERTLRWFAQDKDVQNVTPDCGEVFRKTLLMQGAVVNFVRSDAEGNVICSGLPYQEGTNFRGEGWWQTGKAAQTITVSAPTIGVVSKRRVMVAMWPLYNADGSFRGAVSAGVRMSWLEDSIAGLKLSPTAMVAIVDASGKVLMRTGTHPLDRVTLQQEEGRVVEGTLVDGSSWLMSTAPIFKNKLFVVFAEPKRELLSIANDFWVQALIVPIAILLFTSVAVWWGVQTMVIKWLQRLQDKTIRIANGTYVQSAHGFDGAAPEIAQFADTLRRMASDIDKQKQQLNDALVRAHALTREINHRVKNNLQIILSLLHMQRAEMEEPAMRQILSQTIARMGAVAATQRLTYETSELADAGDVDMAALLNALTQQLRGAFSENKGKIDARSSIDALPISQALPISLIVVEAVTNAITHGFSGAEGNVSISLDTEGDYAILTISDDGRGYDQKRDGQKLGLTLIEALISQLQGKHEIQRNGSGGTVLRATFPIATS